MAIRTLFREIYRMISVLSVYLCFLFTPDPVVAQPAQMLTQAGFTEELHKAYNQNNDQLAASLIRGHRLFVKQFVDGLIQESIYYELKGKNSESKQAQVHAGKTATIFEKIFGEKSLTLAVNYLTIWSEEQKEKKLFADSLYALATKFRVGREPDSALVYYQKALHQYIEITDERGEAEVLGGIGAVYFTPADYDKALVYYHEALDKRIGVDDRQLTGNTLNGIGSVYLNYMGDYQQAIQYYDRAEAIREEVGDMTGLRTTRLYKATAYMNSADKLSNSARYPEALEHLEIALDLNNKISANLRIGETLNQMGLIYSRIGDYNTAVEKLSEAAEIMKREEDAAGLAGVYNHFGIVLQAAGRIERALEYYNSSMKIYETRNDLARLLPVLSNLGTLFFDLKDYSKAEDFHKRGLQISREIEAGDEEVNYLLNLANDYTLLGDLDEAMSNYCSAREVAASLDNPELNWRIAAGMAENHEMRGEFEKSVGLNDTVLLIIEDIRNTLEDKELKAFYLARERYVFEDIINLLRILHEQDNTKGYDIRAFQYAEKCKSRVLLDLLTESLTAGVTEGAAHGSAGLQSNLPVSVKEVQALCSDDNTIILEYSVGDSSSCLWAISRSDFRLLSLPGRKSLQEQIETIRFALLDQEQSKPQFFSHTAFTLYEELIRPAEPLFTKKSRLIIIADDILNYLPFEVLLTESEGISSADSWHDLPFLVRKYPVSYIQSATVLKTLLSSRVETSGARPPAKRLIAFGDPVYENMEDLNYQGARRYDKLDYSGREVERIASFFKRGYAEIYLGNQSTEENVKLNGRLSKADYLHFATHGIIDEEKPDLSALVLTQGIGSEEDGLLQANEIFNLKLNAGLVVLSACQTGLGKLIRGEGMVGLTRAFMYAGTPSVLVSLWSVSDNSTATLMGEFYKNLVRNKLSKTDALRKAQLTLMSDQQFAHPFYWAPFVLIGDWR